MWRYSLFDFPTDGSEGDLDTWCARLAEDGWQLWDAGIGAVIDHEGGEVRRLSLRREAGHHLSEVTSGSGGGSSSSIVNRKSR
jgi:hypothetical protein